MIRPLEHVATEPQRRKISEYSVLACEAEFGMNSMIGEADVLGTGKFSLRVESEVVESDYVSRKMDSLVQEVAVT